MYLASGINYDMYRRQSGEMKRGIVSMQSYRVGVMNERS